MATDQFLLQTKMPTKILVESEKFTSCAKVVFSSKSDSFYCVKSTGDIDIFSLSANGRVDYKTSISTRNGKRHKTKLISSLNSIQNKFFFFCFSVIKDTISLVCLSQCEQYFVCSGSCGVTAVWSRKGSDWSYLNTIVKSQYAVTAMAIHNKCSRIVLAFSDYKVWACWQIINCL